jgi:cell wall-associated NlpC family hydrolase
LRFTTGLVFFSIMIANCLVSAEARTPGSAIVSVAQLRAPDVAMWVSRTQSHSSHSTLAKKRSGAIRRLALRMVGRIPRLANVLLHNALLYVGTPYVYGGESPHGFDCSGYVQYVFASLGLRIPRTADAQYYAGRRVAGGLVPGDLVFFQTYLPGPSHVGIYVGNGRFVHSAGRGVKITSLRDSYYAPRYIGAKRFLRGH